MIILNRAISSLKKLLQEDPNFTPEFKASMEKALEIATGKDYSKSNMDETKIFESEIHFLGNP